MVAAKKWSFELFYWDLTIGLFVTALIAALTLGSLGSDGRTFFDDLAVMDWSSIRYALLGGIVWNFGNIFLTAAIAVAGMAIGFPIGGGLAWIGGIIFNYLLITFSGQVYPGNQMLLWIGVAIIIVAILVCAKIYGKVSSTNTTSNPKKGIMLAVVAGLAIMFFYGLVVKSIDPQYVAGGTGTLSPFTGVFFFATGVLLTTPIFNTFAMKHPVQGEEVTMKEYFAGDTRTHLIGVLGGVIWMSGMAVSFMGAGAANPAISYALSNAAPVVAMIWGVFVWKEFKDAPQGTGRLIAAMFLLFIVGLVLITMSN
ncbi:GRP family sugar transporter [Parabacteroides sp. OttesenSCG-928-G07]|nr:GRP family sugar transporter [Parabacteroides sp. OttesenSCG-928-G07]